MTQESEHVQFASLADRQKSYFLFGGMLFLGASLSLYLLTGYMVLSLSIRGPIIEIPFGADLGAIGAGAVVSQRDFYNYIGRILGFAFAPGVCLLAAVICSIVGIRLLRSTGAVTTQVISAQDYPILGPAISAGNNEAVTQFIRLSSLSGLTGTFTKIGLSGLPLATIFLTIFLAIMGIVNAQFFDLAKLTLGAFLGSFVQRQAEVSGRARIEPQ